MALGLGLAVAAVTAAGAAGALPGPAQDAIASVVSATTPFNLADRNGATDLVEAETTGPDLLETDEAGKSVDNEENEGDDEGVGVRAVNHGACVSAAARGESEPGTHGKTVSSVARSDCGKTDTTPASVTTSTTSTTSTTVSIPGENRTAESDKGKANGGRGRSGNGGSGGRGNSPGAPGKD